MSASSSTAEKTIILITGVHVGNLGHATIQALLAQPPKDGKGFVIIVTARSLDKIEVMAREFEKEATAAGSEVVPMVLDLDSEESMEKLRKDVADRFGRVDVLVNSAGVSLDLQVGSGKLTASESLNKTFNTNVTAQHLLTDKFMPLVFASHAATPRLIFVTSSVGSLAQQSMTAFPINAVPAAGWPKPYHYNIMTYRTSKAALNMLALEWTRTLKNDKIKVFILNPGYLATGFGGQPAEQVLQYGGIEPIVGGRFLRTVIEGARDADEGVMIEKDGVVPW